MVTISTAKVVHEPVQLPARGDAAPSLPIPLRHQALVQTIVSRARVLPAPGAVEVRFALQPAELGMVRVRIETRGDRVRVEITVSSAAALDAIGSGVSRLAQQLQDAGFRTPEVKFGLDSAPGDGADHRATRHGLERNASHGGADAALPAKPTDGDTPPIGLDRRVRLDRTV